MIAKHAHCQTTWTRWQIASSSEMVLCGDQLPQELDWRKNTPIEFQSLLSQQVTIIYPKRVDFNGGLFAIVFTWSFVHICSAIVSATEGCVVSIVYSVQ